MRKFILLLALTSSAYAFQFGNNTKILVDELQQNNASNITMLSDVVFDTQSADTVPFLNADKRLTSSLVTAVELGHLAGSTSNIQTQLDAKLESPIDLTTNVSGILPIVNGGTGSSTQNFVDLTTLQSIAGAKTFSDDMSLTSNGALQFPSGTTAQRPTGVNGKIRYNSENDKFEGYAAGAWGDIGGGIDIGSSNDNAIVRWDGTGGDAVQNSSVIVDDSDNITGISKATINELEVNGAALVVSSVLDVGGTTKGTRPFPLVTTIQRDAIATPSAGLMVYNTDTNQINIYNGTEWGSIGGGGSQIVEDYWIDQATNASTDLADEYEFNLGTANVIKDTASGFSVTDDAANTRTKINISKKGTYVITYSSSQQANRPATLRVNDADMWVIGSGYGSGSGNQSFVTAKFELENGDFVTFGGSSGKSFAGNVVSGATRFAILKITAIYPSIDPVDAPVTTSAYNTTGDITSSESCLVSNNGSASTSSSLCDNWITSVTRSALGTVDVVYTVGVFSDTPLCSVLPRRVDNFTTDVKFDTESATGISIYSTRNDAAYDMDFMISCRGLK